VPAVDGLVVEGEAGELLYEALGVVLEPLPRLLAPPVRQVTLSTTFSFNLISAGILAQYMGLETE
jgi:hypothetical protein